MTTTYSESAIDRAVRTFLESHPGLQQFGQINDDAVFDGRTACTHTCWQIIAALWTGRLYSLNKINSLAGMPYQARNADGEPRGMRHSESQTVVRRLGLPYTLVLDKSWEELQVLQQRGPIIYSVRYGSEPDQLGYVSRAGIKADGKPNGYASRGGKTQMTGFENGAHAVLGGLARYAFEPASSGATPVRHIEELRRDPNHGNAARPERPPYDIITPAQAGREYDDYRDVLNRTRFAWVPNIALPTGGA
jgi:hypothetical protein